MSTKRTRRPSAATVIACLALFAALSGTAVAAKNLITGKDIAKGTVTSKNIKDKTLKTKDLSKKTVKSLKGATGPEGPAGPKGAAGPQGPAGVAEAIHAVAGSINLAANAEVTVINRSLPSGDYVLLAKTNLFSSGADAVGCRIEAGGAELDRIQWNPPASNVRTPVSLQTVAIGINAAQLVCNAGDAPGSAFENSLIAIPIA